MPKTIQSVAFALCSAYIVAAGEIDTNRISLLSKLSLEDVLITSVSRKPEKWFQAASAVSVITGEQMIHSGVRTLPDALRLVPGVQVANQNANIWAISTRGFSDRFANKLLVLIDGRAVYTPNFAGVFWDLHDLLLEDIDRIEVIRGPGGTLWGANAVNGVINIITKSSTETTGTYANGGYGSHDPGFGAIRYGQAVGKNGFIRAYTKYDKHDDFPLPNGSSGSDQWDTARTGFRMDWALEPNRLTFLGDYFYGQRAERLSIPSFAPPFSRVIDGDLLARGGNVLSRWEHEFEGDADLWLQTYYDYFSRIEPERLFDEQQHTFDVDYQHRFRLPLGQELVYGLGYRFVHHAAGNRDPFVQFSPRSRDFHLFSAFVQDEIMLIEDRLRVVAGSKVEHHEYTGFEIQPNARLAWTPSEDHTVWAAVSRAVRTPSRGERDNQTTFASPIPGVFGRTYGNNGIGSEEMLSYELGYRVRPLPNVTMDLAAFYADYDRLSVAIVDPASAFLETIPAPPHFILPTMAEGEGQAWSKGTELSLQIEANDWWTLRMGYTYVETHIPPNAHVGLKDPEHQIFGHSMMNLGNDWHLDLVGRYVDSIHYRSIGGSDDVPAYLTADARLAWNPTRHVEIAVVGRNLVEPRHREFVSQFLYSSEITSVPRSIFGMITLRF